MSILLKFNCLIIVTSLLWHAPLYPAENGLRWSAGAGPAFFVPDADFFGAELSPGINTSLQLELNRNLSLTQSFEYFYSPAGEDNFEIFNNRLNLDYLPLGRMKFYPAFSAGIAFLSFNPSAAEGPRKTFRPAQTVFCLNLGAGGVLSGTGRGFSISTSVHVLATPYKYRTYKFDDCRAVSGDYQFTHFSGSLRINYTF
jgi:hypothetical protein